MCKKRPVPAFTSEKTDRMASIQMLFRVLSCTLLCFSSAGCNSDSIKDVEIPIPDASTYDDQQLKTLPVTETTDLESPAGKAFELPGADASPVLVCREFLQLLNKEEPDHFALLLTPAALSVSNQLKFHLPPIADPGTEIELSEPEFNTIREKLCFIDCSFSAAEHSEMSKVTMMLRKMKAGWRVAGMMIESDTPDAKNLISFENSVDVLQIKTSLEATAAQGADDVD